MFLTYALLSPENVRYWVKVFLGGWFRLQDLDLYATNTVKQYKRYIMSERPSSILSCACHSRHLWCRKKPHSGIEVGFMISEDFFHGNWWIVYLISWELVICLFTFIYWQLHGKFQKHPESLKYLGMRPSVHWLCPRLRSRNSQSCSSLIISCLFIF